MRKIAPAALVFVAMSLSMPADAAIPHPGAVPSDAVTANVTPVAMGCGAGQKRDAMGRCHHRFNLFRHHGKFRAYKDRHCTPMMTPNGRVDRCKI